MERSWQYRDENGANYGPYTREELERYAAEGRVSIDGMVAGANGKWITPEEAGLVLRAQPPIEPLGTATTTPPTNSSQAIDTARAAASMNKSSHNRVAYILLGILLPLAVCGLAGVNNLMVGRTGIGAVQLTLSITGMVLNGIGMIVGVTVCLGIPLSAAVVIWSIVEAATNDRDGAGLVMQ